MGVNTHAAVTAWLADSGLAQLTTAGVARIDLGDLLAEPPPLAVRTGLVCAELAVILARQEEPDTDGLLTIPLPGSTALTHDSPSVDDMLAQAWEYGPGVQVPCLHLVGSRHWRAYAEVEEYRTHLPVEGSLPPGWAAYYRTWRTQAGSASDSEYQREICVRTIDGG